ncbi:MAG: twin-arginine translocase TatA/TatE family subunit [SAR324 cluster bacterium]|nr:twin-arginine translocase TatA/TatE family subunit [SAR324 cluster bacterium]
MFGLGIWELVIILTIVVLLFGAKRLPLIGEGVGKMINNFKREKQADPTLEHNKEEKTATVVEHPENQTQS